MAVRSTRAQIDWRDRLQGAQTQDLAREVGDFVVKRADGLFAYQLAVVVDDAAQGITDVVRGADLIASTPRQILLQRRLGFATPSYLHVPIAIDAAGRQAFEADPRRAAAGGPAAGARRGVALPRSAAARRLGNAGDDRRVLAWAVARVESGATAAAADAARAARIPAARTGQRIISAFAEPDPPGRSIPVGKSAAAGRLAQPSRPPRIPTP